MSVDKMMGWLMDWLAQTVTMPRWAAVVIFVVGLILPVVVREIMAEMSDERDYRRRAYLHDLDTR